MPAIEFQSGTPVAVASSGVPNSLSLLVGMLRSDNHDEVTVMRAIVLGEFGPPERLEPAELPAPAAGSDEVLVDVELAVGTARLWEQA